MLKGVYTAIVTPFKMDGSIDEVRFRSLIEEQIKAGVTGILPCGTTGESPTLNHEEHNRVIEICCDQVKGRCEVMAGTGSNSTAEAIFMTEHAKKAGATSTLQVVPYYNKPTQKGMYEHFIKIADTVNLPVVIYNIPGRTGINLETKTLAELAKHKNIIAVKEASGSIAQMMSVISAVPEDFSVLSGDDKLTLPLIAVGGHGVVSVASNIIPETMVEMVQLGLSGNIAGMRKLHYELSELFDTLFIETNPLPVKAVLALLGKVENSFRLPMCPPSDESVVILKKLIEKYKIK